MATAEVHLFPEMNIGVGGEGLVPNHQRRTSGHQEVAVGIHRQMMEDTRPLLMAQQDIPLMATTPLQVGLSWFLVSEEK